MWRKKLFSCSHWHPNLWQGITSTYCLILKVQCVGLGRRKKLTATFLFMFFVSLQSPESKSCVDFLTLDWVFSIYRGSTASSTQPAMFFMSSFDPTNKQWLGILHSLVPAINGVPPHWKGDGGGRSRISKLFWLQNAKPLNPTHWTFKGFKQIRQQLTASKSTAVSNEWNNLFHCVHW